MYAGSSEQACKGEPLDMPRLIAALRERGCEVSETGLNNDAAASLDALESGAVPMVVRCGPPAG